MISTIGSLRIAKKLAGYLRGTVKGYNHSLEYPSQMIPLRSFCVTGALVLSGYVNFALAQTETYRAPRAWDGHPDLNGIWQALGTANWNLEDHSAEQGPVWELGAIAAVPPGMSVVEGGVIPYLPAALQTRKANYDNRRTEDPEAKCYMGGIPRANYMPYPFQIVQSTQGILFVYQFATASRLVNMGPPVKASTDTWMGTNNGRWEGETLVIDVTGLNGLAWLDRAGNWTSDAVHVLERVTPRSAETLMYEATIEDRNVFARPWKIRVPLYRRVEQDAQLLDFKCVEFSEKLIYGKDTKPPAAPSIKK
jgi:hypothetical protein